MINHVTALIKTFERPNYLNRLITSIRKFYPDLKVIVADDSREPRPIEGIKVIKLPFDTGIAGGRNAALKQITTKYFLLLDDDVVFTKHTKLDRMYDILENSEIDIIAGKRGASFEGTFEIVGHTMRHLKKKKDTIYGCGIYDVVHNFFMADTKKVKDLGGWDRRFKIGGEHGDFFLRAKKANLVVGYCGDVAIRHSHDLPMTPFYKQYRARPPKLKTTQLMMKKHGLKIAIDRGGRKHRLE